MAQTVRIQMRRDDAQNWADSSVVLSPGEPAFDTTNNILKIGPTGGDTWSNITSTFIPIPVRYDIPQFEVYTQPATSNGTVYFGSPITIPTTGTWHFGANVYVRITQDINGANSTLQFVWYYKPGGTGEYQVYSPTNSMIISNYKTGNELNETFEITASGLSKNDTFILGAYVYTEFTDNIDPLATVSINYAEGWLMYPNQPSATWT